MLRKVLFIAGYVLLAGSFLVAAILPLGSVAAYLPVDSELRLSGSTTVFPIVEFGIGRFPATPAGAGVTLNVSQGGSGVGKTNALDELNDIAMSSSSCKDYTGGTGPGHIANYDFLGNPAPGTAAVNDPAGLDNAFISGTLYGSSPVKAWTSVTLRPHTCAQLTKPVIGLDGISVIVNVNNPCTNPAELVFTKADLEGIWGPGNGGSVPNITQWNQISRAVQAGCPATPMLIVAREVGAGTRASFLDIIKGTLTEASEQTKIAASGVRGNGSPAVRDIVNGVTVPPADAARAIGYVGLNFVGGQNRATGIECATFGKTGCSQNTVATPVLNYENPSIATIQNGKYPLGRALYLMYLATNPSVAQIQSFVNWTLGLDGQRVVELAEYIPNTGAVIAKDCDVNLDGSCDTGDVVVIGLTSNWLVGNPLEGWLRADANIDGSIDTGDVVLIGLTSNWLQPSP